VSIAAPVETPFEQRIAGLVAANERIAVERDGYKKLYPETLALCRKLERGILGQKREKLSPGDAQITMSLLDDAAEPGAGMGTAQPSTTTSEEVRAHSRRKPTGRKPIPGEGGVPTRPLLGAGRARATRPVRILVEA
jgi:hypothetical protein